MGIGYLRPNTYLEIQGWNPREFTPWAALFCLLGLCLVRLGNATCKRRIGALAAATSLWIWLAIWEQYVLLQIFQFDMGGLLRDNTVRAWAMTCFLTLSTVAIFLHVLALAAWRSTREPGRRC